MEHFVCSAEDSVQRLVRLQADTSEIYDTMIVYLGEKPDSTEGKQIFSIIQTFLNKFDQARQRLAEDSCLLSPRTPTSDAAMFISGLNSLPRT